jgi:class 3 adenylate cyclase/HAMP domain-containing protein
MGSDDSGNNRKGAVSLRAKIIIAFFVISSLVSLGLAGSTYQMVNRTLFGELRSRVRNLTSVGSLMVNRPALARLVAELESDVETRAVEASPDYALVSRQLNQIRDTDKELVRYVYLFAPAGDESAARYVVDADVLSLRASGAAQEEISSFGKAFDLSEFPIARQAVRDRAVLVEEQYSFDREFGVNSVSGYAPVLDGDGKTLLAVLGIDMVDTDVRAALRRTTLISAITAGIALLLALASSIAMGNVFTRGIMALDRVVRRFSDRDLAVRAEVRTKDEVGRLGLSFNEMAGMIQRYNRQLEQLLSAYGRFVPHDFLRFLEKETILDVSLGDQVQKDMTVLFSDIRSFTALSESMSPRENFNFLNSYLSRIGPEIRNHKGFIDKYIGDAIMALFPEQPEDAVDAAIAMRARLREYNIHRASAGYRPISTGIAINTGRLMLGTLGELERMDGSVISDAVNLCARLESLSRIYGECILMTGETLSRLDRKRGYGVRFVDRVRVRGRKAAVLIYEVFDGDAPEQRDAKARTKALNLYYDRRFVEAYRSLRALRAANPGDPAVGVYLKRCIPLVRKGAPEGWDGVEVIDLK